MGSLSLQTANKIMATFSSEFSKRMNLEDELPHWHDKLQAAGMNDDNAGALYNRWAKAWTKSFKPTLHDLTQFVRNNAYTHTEFRRFEKRKCALCSDTGFVDVPEPVDYEGTALRWLDKFRPGEIWAKTEVYDTRLPCVCSRGQQRETRNPLDAKAAQMRDAAVKWYQDSECGPAVTLARYKVQCYQARKPPGEPPAAIEGEQPQKGMLARMLAEKGRDDPLPGDHELIGGEDVPESKIPF